MYDFLAIKWLNIFMCNYKIVSFKRRWTWTINYKEAQSNPNIYLWFIFFRKAREFRDSFETDKLYPC